jgi:DNA-binding CsgD family transcriptional regulator
MGVWSAVPVNVGSLSERMQLEACLRAVLSPVELPAIDGPCAAAAEALIRLLPRSGVRLIVERLRPRSLDAEALRARYGLTPREAQVARLLAQGLSNARLAATLGVSIHTVQRHTERVFRKLGIHARAAVAGVVLSFEHPR